MATAVGVAELDTLNELLIASAQGDRSAFTRLYKLSAPMMFAIALRTVRQRDLAEDILQDAFVTIWSKAAQFDPARGQPMAWMITIVRRKAIDKLRAKARQPNESANLDDLAEVLPDPATGGASFASAAAAALEQCLGRLKAEPQKAIRLAYFYGLTHEELADQMKSPLGTTKSWVRRGLLQIKECLDQ